MEIQNIKDKSYHNTGNSDVLKLLSKCGTVLDIVALPNLFHYISRFELMKGNVNYTSAGIWDNTHFKWYTFSTGRVLLEKNGFEIINATVTGSLPGNSFFSKILSKKMFLKLYNELKKFSPGLFGYQLFYTARAIKE